MVGIFNNSEGPEVGIIVGRVVGNGTDVING